MPTLSDAAIADLLKPYLSNPPATLLPKLSAYLDLLLKWNARTNLTAIRDPEEIVRRHFGESLFAASHLPLESDLRVEKPDPSIPAAGAFTLLDLGSGAGFPGLPIALLCPGVQVTLAESQNKKAAFLREVVRTLNLSNVEVWAARAETLPAHRQFRVVTLRAVDNMEAALFAARVRVVPGGLLALLTTIQQVPGAGRSIPLPNSQSGILYLQSF
ncbi:MAG TPA: 16S rRNA (guanine(527)-N(7))-methyltransferase RsmG [Edaphobacter sp.]|jgi:16S rRNA (guanine527-N7)-methyltransferase|nr:16S rRNA (guanine(527)-N(7))-methyltransferase RsmG [Edaphobacter sp.]